MGKTASALSVENQSFSKGWVYDNSGEPSRFDPMKLPAVKRTGWAETLGITFDLVHTGMSGYRVFARPWDDRQISFYASRLVEGTDYTLGEPAEDGRRNLSIKNHAIVRYVRSPLPPIDPQTEDAVLAGILSGALLRTEKERSGHKILHITKVDQVAETVEDLARIRKLHVTKYDYLKMDNGREHPVSSLWFLSPAEVQNYILDDFMPPEDFYQRLPDWTQNYQAVLLEQTNFANHITNDRWFKQGRLSQTEYVALTKEQRQIRAELKECEREFADLTGPAPLEAFDGNGGLEARRARELLAKDKKRRLQQRYGKIESQLFDLRESRPPKKRGDGYGRVRGREEMTRRREAERL